MISGANISADEKYRYSLWRQWDATKPYALLVGLNPSTANAEKNDHTITKEIEFARRLGCGGLMKANLFAWRATDRDEILRVADPVGPENDMWLWHFFIDAKRLSFPVVCVWGRADNDVVVARAEHVKNGLRTAGVIPLVFGFTKQGQPLHTLTLPYKTEARQWAL